MICSGAEPFFLPGGPQGVLLVHGFTGSPADLLLLGRFLQARGCTVLGVRLAGHATSEEDLSRQTAEDWLDSVRDGAALLRGCTQTLSVVGHSLGGVLAFLLAMEQPLRRIVSLATPVDIAPERGADQLPPRSLCAGRYAPKRRRRMRDVPPAVNESYTGLGDSYNYGIRILHPLDDGSGLIAGMANPFNLRPDGGWELRLLNEGAPAATGKPIAKPRR